MQVITPWKATTETGKFEYDRLIEQFGVEPITEELIARFEHITNKPIHPWIRRGLFFAHRNLSDILDAYEKKEPIYLYTGRGPTTEALHLGHIVPFMMTKWLQDMFDAYVIIQMADDEKYYFKDMEFDYIYKLGFQNAKDIIAVGFNPDKTFIFSNRDYSVRPEMRSVIHELMKFVRVKDLQSVFGFEDTSNIGQLVWPLYQMAASYSVVFKEILGEKPIHCLIVYAIDQDPYFRMAREMASKFGCPKPCSIMSQFLPGLEGAGKMSSSGDAPKTIFMTDDPINVQDKIKKYAFSGGGDTLKKHREFGANLDIDIPFQYLRYFLYDDDRLLDIGSEYGSGRMGTGEIKKIAADIIINLVSEHQENRAKVDDVVLNKFYSVKK